MSVFFSRGERSIGRHLAAAALVALSAAFVYGTIAWGMFANFGDFEDHLDWAHRFYETGRPPVPHFLFHALTAMLFGTSVAASYEIAGRLVMVGAYALTGLVAYAVYWDAFRGTRLGQPWLLAAVGLVTLAAQPITLADTYALGYLWPEPYHSPTFAVMKPFALAAFAATAWCLAHREGASGRVIGVFALVTIASALSKPNFVICVLPAAAILTAHRLARGLPLSRRGLLGGLFVPAAVVLAWQFAVAFSGGDAEGMYQDSVSWAPLQFMRYWATDLTAKFAASIAFPLLVLVLYWTRASRDPVLQLGWLCFAFGAFYSYTLAETVNLTAGNFVWSGYITLFTLFAATIVFWLRELHVPLRGAALGRAVVCGVAIVLHVASGIRLDWLYLIHADCRVDLRLAEFVCADED